MIKEDFLPFVTPNLPFEPTPMQQEVILTFFDFLTSTDAVFLLKGYAGTGKSSLMGGIIRSIVGAGRKPVLLAPTGRAAKVFEEYSGFPAFTIHRRIYRQKSFNGSEGVFDPAPNMSSNTLFFVDEASMISNREGENRIFGTGRLLDDLIHHVYNGRNCKLILVGDTAQLPPVGETLSPAMMSDELKRYDLEVYECNLTDVVRQREESGILHNATLVRSLIENGGNFDELPKLELKGFQDIRHIGGRGISEYLESSYSRVGLDETLIITRSNLLATRYNQEIRARVLFREEELSPGDWVVVAKNNYLWLNDYVTDDSLATRSPFIANGEIALVERVRRHTQFAGLRFAEAQVYLPNQALSIEATVLLDTLSNGSASLPREQSERLFVELMESYGDLRNKRDKYQRLKADPYYNALHIKFAYSVTGHKAQGGQWKETYIDLSNLNKEHLGLDFYRWLYTALTRATQRVYLINTPPEMLDEVYDEYA